ncbi:MAG: branched-chain amino acid ABC transporter permease [Nitrospirae bacterium]|nr:branched-chain amino acid ABC transporter permease [Nitrospirota bacterium]
MLSYLNSYYIQIGSFTLINIMLALGVYVPLSTGQLSLGGAGFMGLGAYLSAIAVTRFGLPIPFAIVIAGGVSTLAGILVGVPSLRLKGVYLAIATLGFGEVIRVIFIKWETITGGATGISAIPLISAGTVRFLTEQNIIDSSNKNVASDLTVFLILFLITGFFVWFFVALKNTRIWRANSAIRLDETASESIGINIHYYKVLAFSQSAFISAIAGALYAHTVSYISPSDFTYHRAVEALIFTVLGGSGHVLGAVFGATVLTIIPEALRFLKDYRYVAFGAILVIMMAFKPEGIITDNIFRKIRKK